ncbi:lysophospholipid acyltransferase family protein [Phenylobacterium immobile]|uniref:lysophospholipid acyltransferase family protein n=1 Tax=Phenylobacterium immobile TaxID=21 RepID=UPI000B1B773C|nr:hypothetical protein [Phenylobacterium immobile]
MPAPALHWLLSPERERRVAARRYWIADVVDGAYKWGAHLVLRALPVDWASGFGAWTGKFSPRIYPAEDARARLAWRRLRPEAATDAEVDAAVARLWRNVGRTVTEFAVLDKLWDQGRVTVKGAEHMAALRDSGAPILVASLHLANWELIPISGIKLGYMGAAIALPLPNRFERALMTRIREGFGGRQIMASATAGRAMVRELKARGPLVLHVDDFTRGKVNAPAFGRPQSADGNIAYVFRLAKLTGAAIIPVYCAREGDAARFTVNFQPRFQVTDTGDAAADLVDNVARLNALIEPIVRDHLDEWFYVLDLDLEGDGVAS